MESGEGDDERTGLGVVNNESTNNVSTKTQIVPEMRSGTETSRRTTSVSMNGESSLVPRPTVLKMSKTDVYGLHFPMETVIVVVLPSFNDNGGSDTRLL